KAELFPLRGLGGENKRADGPPSLTPYHGKREAYDVHKMFYSTPSWVIINILNTRSGKSTP
ncbi:MAG: hypothetical protein ACLFVG_07030, partial [Candidatus Aminicenantes bacterium]